MRIVTLIIVTLILFSCSPVTQKGSRVKRVKRIAKKGDTHKFNDLKSNYSYQKDSEKYSRNSSKVISKLDREVKRYMGTKYLYGSTNPSKGLDCSAYVKLVYKRAFNYTLPRTSRTQYGIGIPVSRDDLRPGDLVFFKMKFTRVDHVGIYLRDGNFTHASVSSGVTISKLSDNYYNKRYAGARRIF